MSTANVVQFCGECWSSAPAESKHRPPPASLSLSSFHRVAFKKPQMRQGGLKTKKFFPTAVGPSGAVHFFWCKSNSLPEMNSTVA